MTPRAARLRAIALLLLCLAGAWAAVATGSHDGSARFDAAWLRHLFDGADTLELRLLLHYRLPRVCAALIVGAALAVAGAVLQGAVRNPLADPYLLGISGGAGLFVVLVRCVLPLQAVEWWLTPLCAFAGAFAAGLFVLALSRGAAGRLTTVGLILAGVVVNALAAAATTFVLARVDPFRLRVTTLWLAGGVGYASWPQLALAGVLVVGAGVALRAEAHRLNALSLGEQGAASVGVDAESLLRRAALLSSLLAAVAASLAGLLGYVGLIVPHAARLVLGKDFRQLLGGCAAAGALLVVAADTLARTAFAPEELPVGVITALLGCPVLLVLLRAQLRGGAR